MLIFMFGAFFLFLNINKCSLSREKSKSFKERVTTNLFHSFRRKNVKNETKKIDNDHGHSMALNNDKNDAETNSHSHEGIKRSRSSVCDVGNNSLGDRFKFVRNRDGTPMAHVSESQDDCVSFSNTNISSKTYDGTQSLPNPKKQRQFFEIYFKKNTGINNQAIGKPEASTYQSFEAIDEDYKQHYE